MEQILSIPFIVIHKMCIRDSYCSTEEDTVYYGSYIKNKEETEEQ